MTRGPLSFGLLGERRRVTLATLPLVVRTVVVLGAPATRGITPLLGARLQGAADAANQLAAPVLVSGNGAPGIYNEIDPMVAWLRPRLDAPDRLAAFGGAVRTFHSIVDAVAREGPILLVTSDFHLARALFLARGLGVDAYGLACPTPVRRLKRAKLQARERVAQARAVMDVGRWQLMRRRGESHAGRRS